MIECPTCNVQEQYVLEQLQTKAEIKDKTALAVIMGNIKQESGFRPKVCEGGAILPYDRCLRGGYGLIQWTSSNRYHGLGRFCEKHNCNPSSLAGQVSYMLNEYQFQKMLANFQRPFQTVQFYMNSAYRWLGWGVKGPREQFAYNYLRKFK